jgi:hypothetical protein
VILAVAVDGRPAATLTASLDDGTAIAGTDDMFVLP